MRKSTRDDLLNLRCPICGQLVTISSTDFSHPDGCNIEFVCSICCASIDMVIAGFMVPDQTRLEPVNSNAPGQQPPVENVPDAEDWIQAELANSEEVDKDK